MRHQIPSFQQWRPNSKEDILNHYYQNSDGASLPSWFTGIQEFANSVGAAIANAIVPGSGKLVSELKVMDIQKISASAKRRKQLDSSKEKQRIFDLYKREYVQSTFPNNIHTKTDNEIKAWLKSVQENINVSRNKCKKRDTAGCRFMGILNLRYQYGKFVLEARKQMSNMPQTSGAGVVNKSGNISPAIGNSHFSSTMDKRKTGGILGWLIRILGLK